MHDYNEVNKENEGCNDYVANFAGGSSGVRPLVLSYDYYPDFMINPVANKAGYEANAASFLAASRNNGNSLPSLTITKDLCNLLLWLIGNVPWWNYFNTMPFNAISDPSEPQLRWQISTSLAYGARGVIYHR
jgi:hypothetical protein